MTVEWLNSFSSPGRNCGATFTPDSGRRSSAHVLGTASPAVDIGHPALIKLADTVNKKDLVGKIASDASLTRAQASRALDAFVQGIQASLVRGDRVTISGFGTFGVSHRKARRVRNPRSGSDMEVAAKRVPRFAPGADLRTAIDQPASNS